jgi:hypothetical protein
MFFSLWDLVATLATKFHIGGLSGPAIKREGSALAIRNAADTAPAVLRCGAPVGSTDVANKAYVDAGSGATLPYIDTYTASGAISPGLYSDGSFVGGGYVLLNNVAGVAMTLADPVEIGYRLLIDADVLGLASTVTCASPVNIAGATIITMSAAGSFVELIAVQLNSALVWRVGANDGISLA